MTEDIEKYKAAYLYSANPIRIDITLVRYSLFSSQAEITISAEATEPLELIDNMLEVIKYISNKKIMGQG
jgi:hypothetical protein